MSIKSARFAAFQAQLVATKQSAYIKDFLLEWKAREAPSDRDYRFALELAQGAYRQSIYLEAALKQAALGSKLKVKQQERILLVSAAYQLLVMKLPAYAVLSETMLIASKVCHKRQRPFFNAILKKLSEKEDLHFDEKTRYSLPAYLYDLLKATYSKEDCQNIFEAYLQVPACTARIIEEDGSFETIKGLPLAMTLLDKPQEQFDSPKIYIQNLSQALIIHKLLAGKVNVSSVVDLCSAPGGKTIAIKALYPDSTVTANELSEKKLARLEENFEKYAIEAEITCLDARDFPEDKQFSLVICDVPCSNSGCFAKNPEAKYRLTADSLEKLQKSQKAILEKAAKLCEEGGAVLYLTCSILKEENEAIVKEITNQTELQLKAQKLILPQGNYEGAFGALFIKSS